MKKSFYNVFYRIIDKFNLFHPKLYIKYFKFYSYYKPNLSKENILDILLIIFLKKIKIFIL